MPILYVLRAQPPAPEVEAIRLGDITGPARTVDQVPTGPVIWRDVDGPGTSHTPTGPGK